MSTLPKSIQAQMGDDNQIAAGLGTSQNNAMQTFIDFVNKYKQLPSDFLRIPLSAYPPQDQQQLMLQRGQVPPTAASALFGRLDGPLVDMVDISVVEAQLVKNYGLLRMDLYCKIRVGHMVCETHTCINGAKNPKWDGVYQFSLKPGIDAFHLEIYDENQFKMDEKIAWLAEPIPPEIFQGITVERWFPLSGKSGTNKEGRILLVLSHKRVPMRASNFGRASSSHHGHPPAMTVFVPAAGQPPVLAPGSVPGSVMPVMGSQVVPGGPQPHFIQPDAAAIGIPPPANQLQQPTIQPIREEDVNQLAEMFPSVDKAIIKAVLENNHNDKEAAIGALLALG